MLITDHEKLKEYTATNRLWQGIPSIEVTRNGRIFLAFYSGGTNEEIGNYVVLIKSDDGKNFSEPVAAAFTIAHRCYDPSLWIDPLGRLWFCWAYAPEHAVYASVCDNPDGDELLWSKPRIIGNDVMMNKPVVLKNGEWLFPIAVWAKNITAGGVPSSSDPDRLAFAYRSIDDGRSFQRLGGVSAEGRSFDEHMLLERRDGSIAMYIRTFYGIAVAYSYDGGTTWTDAKDSGLGGPCSRFYIGRLKSGRVLLINHHAFHGRNNLTAMLSEDDGATWKYKLLLDGRSDVSYPDVKEADDGYIYICYDRERGDSLDSLEKTYASAREILYAKITEDDIIAGKPQSPDSRLGVVACKLGKYADENENPYHEIRRYSDGEIAKLLYDKNADEIVSTLFENYEINCMNMHRLDSRKMDELIERIGRGDKNKERLIRELVALIRGVTGKGETEIPVVAAVKNILGRHVAENGVAEEVTLERIADRLHVSKFYLCHLFRKATGMTITDMKNRLRVEKAKEILKSGDEKIADVAYECGFDSPSYFTEIFSKSEKIAPEAYRSLMRNNQTEEKSAILRHLLPQIRLSDVDIERLKPNANVKTRFIEKPVEPFLFLHEAAIIEYHGKLFAAWYNNKKTELFGETPIRFAFSSDHGDRWSEPQTIATDPSGKILYCPPVFGIDDDKLYLFMNSMVAPDHIHSLDLYIYNEKANKFDFLWSRSVPFKLNTNVYKLGNGKLILPGRIGEIDGFPSTPAVMISDSGKIDAEWRIVKLAESAVLPDGSKLIHPEVSLIVSDEKIYAFCRNDERNVSLVYISEDYGETWKAFASDLTLADSKIYSGTLSDGRNYLVGTADRERRLLYILFTENGKTRFTDGFILQNGYSPAPTDGIAWSYPAVCDENGILHIAYTVVMNENNERGAMISSVPLADF